MRTIFYNCFPYDICVNLALFTMTLHLKKNIIIVGSLSNKEISVKKKKKINNVFNIFFLSPFDRF